MSRPPTSILIVGDGDLSYSANLLQNESPHTHITATVLEPSSTALTTLYPTAAPNIAALAQHPSATLLFNIDATNLLATLPPNPNPFDRIIFNFPQTPPALRQHRKVQHQRSLLTSFFASVSPPSLLSPSGTVTISLLAGQSGLSLEGRLRRPHPADSWQLVDCAALSRFIVVGAPPHRENSHNPVGYRGTGEPFSVSGARAYECERAGGGGTRPQLEPPHFHFDLSFFAGATWAGNEGKFFKAVRAIAHESATEIDAALTDSDYVDPGTNRATRKYHVHIRAMERTALERTAAVSILEAIKDAAAAIEGGERRGHSNNKNSTTA